MNPEMVLESDRSSAITSATDEEIALADPTEGSPTECLTNEVTQASPDDTYVPRYEAESRDGGARSRPLPSERGVEIRRIQALRGPSIHAYMPVLQITLDIGKYDDTPSTDYPGAKERLLQWLPGLERHTCSI